MTEPGMALNGPPHLAIRSQIYCCSVVYALVGATAKRARFHGVEGIRQLDTQKSQLTLPRLIEERYKRRGVAEKLVKKLHQDIGTPCPEYIR
jgi:hypothetical protein